LLTLLLAFLPGMAVLAQQAPRYRLTDLGAQTTFANSRAYGLNERGQVVGQVANIAQGVEAHAVLWDQGKATVIALPDGLQYGVACAINDAGVVVCGSEILNYGRRGFDISGLPERAFQWHGGRLTELVEQVDDVLAFLNASEARAINNQGQIAGTFCRRPVIWTHGTAAALPMPPKYLFGAASALNERGDAVGYVLDEQKRLAARWTGGTCQLLPIDPTYDQSLALAVNAAGQAVGSCGSKGSYYNAACLWDNGRLLPLPGLEGGVWINQAMDINDQGQIVGYGVQNGAYLHAVLWEGRLPCDLNTLIPQETGLVLMKAVAINNRGQIAGEARDARGHIHAVLLTPLAQPAPGPRPA